MALPFSNSATGNGLVEQIRDICRTDATRYPTQKIVNSLNNHKDMLTGYALFKDWRWQWDDTNHTDLPIGVIDLVADQSDYSYPTDENGNQIITLLRVEVKDANGNWTELKSKDLAEIEGAVENFESTAGVPKYYDKVADNSIRLFPVSSSNVTGGLKLYFQRTATYFTVDSTTETSGFSALLDRGFIMSGAYDCAMTLGLDKLQVFSIEKEKEMVNLERYFSVRNKDEVRGMKPAKQNNR